MKLYALSEETINNLLAYLGTKPLAEVANLYNAVIARQLITNDDGTPLEVPTGKALETLKEAPKAPEASNGSGKEASA